MAVYKNDYRKNEDEVLWELHEIRHELHDELKNKSLQKINREAIAKYKNWKKPEKRRPVISNEKRVTSNKT
jgi:hypothetical protein